MAYEAPSGWIETNEFGDSGKWVFHLLENCDAIGGSSTVAASDKPYSASRCRRCGLDK
jgi:hypothetical protein